MRIFTLGLGPSSPGLNPLLPSPARPRPGRAALGECFGARTSALYRASHALRACPKPSAPHLLSSSPALTPVPHSCPVLSPSSPDLHRALARCSCTRVPVPTYHRLVPSLSYPLRLTYPPMHVPELPPHSHPCPVSSSCLVALPAPNSTYPGPPRLPA